MNFIIAHIRKNALLYILVFTFTLVFFYHLDYNTLGSWDEGWYATIARNIVRSGDIINLTWNGKPYFDHPPFGFWIIALSYKLFGVSELSTRAPQALLGVLTIFFMYKTVLLLFKSRAQAYATALVLGTCVWYVIRVRSGNLDATLVFFYVLTVYLGAKAAKKIVFFPLACASYAALMLTKTLVGLPALFLLLFLNLHHLQPKKLKQTIPYFLLGIVIFIAIFYPWYYIHLKKYPDFIEHHFVNIGTRNKTLASFFQLSIEQPLFYLHMGIRKWYYIWLASIGAIFFLFRFLKKNVLFVLLWNVMIFYPFLTAKETQLWHLIPVYAPVAFVVGYGTYELLMFIKYKIRKKMPQLINQKNLASIYVISFTFIALWQFKNFYKEVYPANKYIPDDVAISKNAARYGKPIYLDDDFLPLAVFYADRNIIPVNSLPDNEKTMVGFFASSEKNFVMITRNWAVEGLKKENIPYVLLEKNNSFSIVTKP